MTNTCCRKKVYRHAGRASTIFLPRMAFFFFSCCMNGMHASIYPSPFAFLSFFCSLDCLFNRLHIGAATVVFVTHINIVVLTKYPYFIVAWKELRNSAWLLRFMLGLCLARVFAKRLYRFKLVYYIVEMDILRNEWTHLLVNLDCYSRKIINRLAFNFKWANESESESKHFVMN